MQRQAEPTPAASPLMNLQQSAGNRAVQRLVQRDEWDLDQLPQRGRSATIDASSSLREGEVTPHAERAAYVSAQGKKLQTALAAEKAQKASGAGWEDRQAAFAASPGAALAPARLQSKTAALVMDSRRLRSEAEHGPSEESRVLAEQAAKKAQAGGAAAPASPVAARPGGPDLAAAASAEGDASKLGIGATATGGVLESAVGGVGGFIGGNVSGATSGPDNKLTSQGLRDTGATGLPGGVGGMVASGLKFGQASELDAQAAALRGGNAAQTATADMLEGQASSARVDGGLGMVGGLSSAVEGGSRLAAAAGSAGGAVATDVMSKVTPGLGVLTGMASTARDLSNWSDQSDRRDNGEIAIGQHLKRTGGKGTAALDMASQLVDAKDRQATRSAASGVGNALSTGANMAAIIPGGHAVGGVLAGGAAV
ncbi:MAG: hypothetical protein Q7K37_11690, partial [Dehalococcoidia bacterium]|nr:hypothetical protein [Dehalococcoidia bacterium]